MKYRIFILLVILLAFHVSFASTQIVITLVNSQERKLTLLDGLKFTMTPTKFEINNGLSLAIEDVARIQYSETTYNTMVGVNNAVLDFGKGYFIVRMHGKNAINIYDVKGVCVFKQTFVDKVDVNCDMIASGIYILKLNGDFFLKIKI